MSQWGVQRDSVTVRAILSGLLQKEPGGDHGGSRRAALTVLLSNLAYMDAYNAARAARLIARVCLRDLGDEEKPSARGDAKVRPIPLLADADEVVGADGADVVSTEQLQLGPVLDKSPTAASNAIDIKSTSEKPATSRRLLSDARNESSIWVDGAAGSAPTPAQQAAAPTPGQRLLLEGVIRQCVAFALLIREPAFNDEVVSRFVPDSSPRAISTILGERVVRRVQEQMREWDAVRPPRRRLSVGGDGTSKQRDTGGRSGEQYL
jgi:hypothetical protein